MQPRGSAACRVVLSSGLAMRKSGDTSEPRPQCPLSEKWAQRCQFGGLSREGRGGALPSRLSVQPTQLSSAPFDVIRSSGDNARPSRRKEAFSEPLSGGPIRLQKKARPPNHRKARRRCRFLGTGPGTGEQASIRSPSGQLCHAGGGGGLSWFSSVYEGAGSGHEGLGQTGLATHSNSGYIPWASPDLSNLPADRYRTPAVGRVCARHWGPSGAPRKPHGNSTGAPRGQALCAADDHVLILKTARGRGGRRRDAGKSVFPSEEGSLQWLTSAQCHRSQVKEQEQGSAPGYWEVTWGYREATEAWTMCGTPGLTGTQSRQGAEASLGHVQAWAAPGTPGSFHGGQHCPPLRNGNTRAPGWGGGMHCPDTGGKSLLTWRLPTRAWLPRPFAGGPPGDTPEPSRGAVLHPARRSPGHPVRAELHTSRFSVSEPPILHGTHLH